VHVNDFLNNGLQADDVRGRNWWNGTSRGNYWSDYAGSDLNCDGAGETFYIVGSAGARDFKPLVKPHGSIAPPCAPRGLLATSSGAQATLKWQPPAYDGDGPITGYRVFRGPDPGNLSEVASLGPVTSHTDAGLEPNLTFAYAVAASNAAGVGRLSSVATVRTWYIPPPRPDLAIEAVTVEPERPEPDQLARLRARVRNIGQATAAAGTVELLHQQDGGSAFVVATASIPTGGLAPHASFDLVAYLGFSAGMHRGIGLVVLGAPGELNTANDESSVGFAVLAKEAGPSRGTSPGRESGGGRAGGAVAAVLASILLLASARWIRALGRRAHQVKGGRRYATAGEAGMKVRR
jgi:hypothetical protein